MMKESPVSSADCGVDTRRRSSRNQSHSTSPSGESNKALGGRLDAVNGDHLDQPSLSATGRPSRRATVKLKKPDAEVIEEALRPLTDEERNSWKGWCELESDPALFNYILRQYGVKNIKIQEVLGLEDDMLQCLPWVIPITIVDHN
ncbi:ubiquitin carboxyl-terminal hydrolase protein [Rutstroemia sp. NJR-2017a WRK4]|nr:ubiquitin carboxyl-terminal hydrolase protein [Rutstroemia sp. NJR-2017a WRK4]